LAVETAVLHNYLWHEKITWRDRPTSERLKLKRLLKFNVSNGAISILGNNAIDAAAGANPVALNCVL
jgi:putative flippase GtrA